MYQGSFWEPAEGTPSKCCPVACGRAGRRLVRRPADGKAEEKSSFFVAFCTGRLRFCKRITQRKDAVLRPGKPAIITGVVRDSGSIHLRNKHHDAIVAAQDSIAHGSLAAVDKLAGQMAAARSVDPQAARKLDARYQRLMFGTKPLGMPS